MQLRNGYCAATRAQLRVRFRGGNTATGCRGTAELHGIKEKYRCRDCIRQRFIFSQYPVLAENSGKVTTYLLREDRPQT